MQPAPSCIHSSSSEHLHLPATHPRVSAPTLVPHATDLCLCTACNALCCCHGQTETLPGCTGPPRPPPVPARVGAATRQDSAGGLMGTVTTSRTAHQTNMISRFSAVADSRARTTITDTRLPPPTHSCCTLPCATVLCSDTSTTAHHGPAAGRQRPRGRTLHHGRHTSRRGSKAHALWRANLGGCYPLRTPPLTKAQRR